MPRQSKICLNMVKCCFLEAPKNGPTGGFRLRNIFQPNQSKNGQKLLSRPKKGPKTNTQTHANTHTLMQTHKHLKMVEKFAATCYPILQSVQQSRNLLKIL